MRINEIRRDDDVVEIIDQRTTYIVWQAVNRFCVISKKDGLSTGFGMHANDRMRHRRDGGLLGIRYGIMAVSART